MVACSQIFMTSVHLFATGSRARPCFSLFSDRASVVCEAQAEVPACNQKHRWKQYRFALPTVVSRRQQERIAGSEELWPLGLDRLGSNCQTFLGYSRECLWVLHIADRQRPGVLLHSLPHPVGPLPPRLHMHQAPTYLQRSAPQRLCTGRT